MGTDLEDLVSERGEVAVEHCRLGIISARAQGSLCDLCSRRRRDVERRVSARSARAAVLPDRPGHDVGLRRAERTPGADVGHDDQRSRRLPHCSGASDRRLECNGGRLDIDVARRPARASRHSDLPDSHHADSTHGACRTACTSALISSAPPSLIPRFDLHERGRPGALPQCARSSDPTYGALAPVDVLFYPVSLDSERTPVQPDRTGATPPLFSTSRCSSRDWGVA